MKKLLSIAVLLLMFVPVAFAQGADPCKNPDLSATEAQNCITGKINTITNMLTGIAAGIAVIAAMIIGIMFVQTNDPADKERLGQRLKMLIVGIVLIALANPIVKALL